MEPAIIIEALQNIINQNAAQNERVLEAVSRQLTEAGAHRPTGGSRAPIPEYSGSPSEDVGNWIFLVEQGFLANATPVDRLVPTAAIHLRGAALQWYRRRLLDGTVPSDWDAFTCALKTVFQPTNLQQVLRLHLDQLKQKPKQPLGEHIKDFLAVMNQIDRMDPEDRIHRFIQSLSPKTCAAVRYAAPKSLEMAIGIARNFESSYLDSINTNAIRDVEVGLQSMDIDFAGSRGRGGKREPRRSTRKVECWECGGDHMRRNCPRIQKKTQVHGAEIKDDISLLCVSTTINGMKATMALDTGATHSVISRTAVERLGLGMGPTQVIVINSDGQETRAGVTDEASVEVAGTVSRISFVVTNLESCDGLLGLDWFCATGAMVEPIKKTLTFPRMATSAAMSMSGVERNECDLQGGWAATGMELWEMAQDRDSLIFLTEVSDPHLDIDDNITWSEKLDIHAMVDEKTLTTSQRGQLLGLLEKNVSSFASTLDELGCCKMAKVTVHTTSNAPIFQHPYRKSYREREVLKDEIAKMLKAGVIRHSRSPWSAPVVLMRKKDV
jgi:hypothetical protein